ncbi:S1/P1 nuclease [Croceicoccus bisphenolivorans]|uniref:S1/P1 nuclease n=1 Tax=Croceicoccus bisphenolivorans TaxID=1783232 RepID=UPI000835F298|nr:S1/P1 nuclease [Croceicoccus bisphenolivorans]
MRKALITLALSLTLAAPAHAWGPTGHRMVGQIAADNVNGRTAAEIALILGAGETLAEASTWPDEQRSDPDPFWQKTSTPWHYVTVTGHPEWRESDAPKEGDAMTALRRFTATLRDPDASREDKATALRFVVHLVGDLHQPLHNGKGDDRGGNDFAVTWFGERANLHSVWDSKLIDGNGLSYTEYVARLEGRMTPEQMIAWWNPDPAVWVAESIVLRDTIYPAEDKRDLGYFYQWQWRPKAELRIEQAGIRVAAYLDEVFAAE